jgi:hypothetical protein
VLYALRGKALRYHTDAVFKCAWSLRNMHKGVGRAESWHDGGVDSAVSCVGDGRNILAFERGRTRYSVVPTAVKRANHLATSEMRLSLPVLESLQYVVIQADSLRIRICLFALTPRGF